MNTEMKDQSYHVWLISTAPGAREWDIFIEAESPELAMEQAEVWAGPSADGYPAIASLCVGCSQCQASLN